MDPLHLCIALGPVAVYLILLGIINLSSRPFITSGSRDTAALGIAVSGLVVAGPMELFFPESGAIPYPGFIWLLLFAFYGLCLTLLVLLVRPRLIVYNVTVDQLRPTLANVVSQLDKEARWAGECLVLPQLGVQLCIESFASMRNAQLVAAGPRQSFDGWRRLEIALGESLRATRNTPNPYGISMLFFGLLITALVTYSMLTDRAGVAHALGEMLWR